jgi:hypothetical protein
MAEVKRSANRTANCDLAMAHSRSGMIHSSSERLKTGKRSFVAASSLGKWPRTLTARRSLELSASMALPRWHCLDGIGGVQNPPHLAGKGMERDDFGPGAPPAPADSRVFATPGALFEGVERGFGVECPVNVLERGRNRLSILPGDEIETVAQQVHDPNAIDRLRFTTAVAFRWAAVVKLRRRRDRPSA